MEAVHRRRRRLEEKGLKGQAEHKRKVEEARWSMQSDWKAPEVSDGVDLARAEEKDNQLVTKRQLTHDFPPDASNDLTWSNLARIYYD